MYICFADTHTFISNSTPESIVFLQVYPKKCGVIADRCVYPMDLKILIFTGGHRLRPGGHDICDWVYQCISSLYPH